MENSIFTTSIQTALYTSTNTYSPKGERGIFFPFSNGETIGERAAGDFLYVKENHLGNVLVTVSDRKLGVDNNSDNIVDFYLADVRSATDYYAFGSPMPGRQFNSPDYKYGFNGKENDPEVVSTGRGTQDYGMRIYNPSLGRFLSSDPIAKQYPELTPYQFASNSPIDGVDLDGLEHVYFDYVIEKLGDKPKLTQTSYNPYAPIHGIQVTVRLSNGEYVKTFIPTEAPPPPAKTNFEQFQSNLNKLDAKARGTTYGDPEAPLHSIETGAKYDIALGPLKVTAKASVIDDGSEKFKKNLSVAADLMATTNFQTSPAGKASVFFKLNFDKPSESAGNTKITVPFFGNNNGAFYFQLVFNQKNGFESLEVGASQGKTISLEQTVATGKLNFANELKK